MEEAPVHSTVRNDKRVSRSLAWIFLALSVVAALAMVLMPVVLIHPFKPQTPSGLQVAYLLRRRSPFLTPLFLIAAMFAAARLWRRARWWTKPLLVFAFLLVSAATWLARQNHFEWMFNPLPNPAYATVDEAPFVDERDMVLAVENNGDAVAYPVRLMAYHHVVQDVVGGTPIIATY
jgi:uncharacterized BrkB/YihY/UPF0761 family membrane protein